MLLEVTHKCHSQLKTGEHVKKCYFGGWVPWQTLRFPLQKGCQGVSYGAECSYEMLVEVSKTLKSLQL